MTRDFNHVSMTGRVTDDITLKKTNSGISVTSFTIAIANGADKVGNEIPADFIDCQAWKGIADTMSKWVKKGNRILIEGKNKKRKYQAKDGRDVYQQYVLVDNFYFLESQKTKTETFSNVVEDIDVEITEDDLPF